MDVAIEANPYIDSSVGALVWVRRRNGSWWPGRILGPEELPGSHLLSPRTGTPVKLLGREDGSVDWYNIEKSRRVKAFRCGDFDECIERAKSLASLLTKKREKYARREDAILHALELEKKHIGEQNYLVDGRFAAGRIYMPSFADDDIMVLDDDMDGMPNHSDFQSDFMDPESSADAAQASLDSLFSLQEDKKFLDTDWEDDITDTLPRMRGLQHFGLKIASSKERKANWSVIYEQNPHLSFTEDEQKMSSCITRNTASCPMPISTKTSSTVKAVSKRKRSSQAVCTEDAASLKKQDRRRLVNSGLDSAIKAADGAIELGSKGSVSYLISSMARNGGTVLPSKQEHNAVMLGNAFRGSSEMRPLTSVCGTQFWPATHIDPRTRLGLVDPSSVMDKACSSLSDHVNANCCEELPYLFVDSQMETAALTGIACPDPFGQRVPASRLAMFPRSINPGSFAGVSDNGLQKAGYFSASENFSSPLPCFSPWPYYGCGPREVIYEKYGHEMGLRGQVPSGGVVGFSDYSFESMISNTTLPMYSLYHHPLENHSTFAKNNLSDRDSSLLLAKGAIKDDILKAPPKSSTQCLSAIANGEETDEDEADSFQPPQDSFNGSPKAVRHQHAQRLMKPKDASDGFCKSPAHYELKSTTARNGFGSMDGLWNERLDDSSDCYTDRNESDNNCNGFVPVPFITKWQAKGRRGVRGCCRNSWVSPAIAVGFRGIMPVMTLPDSLDKTHADSEMTLSGLKLKKRTTRGIKHSLNVDSGSEEEPQKQKSCSWSLQQLVHQDHTANRLRLGSTQSFAGLDVPNSLWFEVPMDEDHSGNASCHEQIPQVSIMSMLKGRPIVGYVVHIEIIDRCGINQSGAIRTHSSGTAVKKSHPVWRTGRRTAMQRVPRLCVTAASRDTQLDNHLQLSHCTFQNRGMGKEGDLICSSTEQRKSSKKTALAPQKTRMLSSIAGQDGTEQDAASKLTTPLETCIPVNVIFSRIREVLYRGLNNGASDSDNVP